MEFIITGRCSLGHLSRNSLGVSGAALQMAMNRQSRAHERRVNEARALARYSSASPPLGAPLRVGELVLLRRANTWFHVEVELRGIDDDLAVILIKGQLERGSLSWLRRAETLR